MSFESNYRHSLQRRKNGQRVHEGLQMWQRAAQRKVGKDRDVLFRCNESRNTEVRKRRQKHNHH
ncbi:MAG: hypothetical protein WC346_07810 [Methanogenium sp.]